MHLKRLIPVILLASLLSGCCIFSPDKIELDQKWKPLTTLVRNDRKESGVYWTESPFVYTRDTCAFLNASKLDQEGILVHEQTHAIRQEATVGGWQSYERRCAEEPGFFIFEEELAWSNQIRYVVQHGGAVDAELVATFMAQNYLTPDGRHLFDHDSQLKWVNEQIALAKSGAK